MALELSALSAAELADLKDELHYLILEKTELDPLTDCWIWIGCWIAKGQGQMRFRGRVALVHRVSQWIYHGKPDPWDRRAKCSQTCRCPACCNPDHLRVTMKV